MKAVKLSDLLVVWDTVSITVVIKMERFLRSCYAFGKHRGDVPISHRLRRTITQADRFATSPLCPVLLFGENLEKKRSWWMSITLQNLSPSRALFIT